MKTVYIFQIDQQITELWHFEILQRVCVAQVFLLILHENLKFKKLYKKLEWKASIWYHEMKTFYIFKIDQQNTNTNSLFLVKAPIMSRIINTMKINTMITLIEIDWLQKMTTQQSLTSVLYKDNNNCNCGTNR